MERRKLGSTNLEVSVIGFGGIPIQKVSLKKAISLVDTLEKHEINFIDTAVGYGKSEELIGEAIKERREKFILATKSPVRDYEGMKKHVEESLKKLNTSYIDLYQLHNVSKIEDYQEVISYDGALRALRDLKKENKIKHIGITSHSVDILRIAVENDEFETIQFPYNILETQAEEVFKRAKELNRGIIIMKPMAGGAIENKELALRFILQNQNITSAIPGMNEENHIEMNAAIGSNQRKLSKIEIEKIEAERKTLGKNFCRRCGYCMPCEKGINIPVQFILEGYKKRYDLSDWAEERYFAQNISAESCTKCGKCEPKCPYNLPIKDMMESVKKTFEKK